MVKNKVSIVITCYNDLDVKTAVESALKQTYAPKEVILVDDGSNERTKEIIGSFKDNLDFYIVQKNKGQSVARNNGIQKARGEFILSLDSDDFFEPTFCEKAVKLFQQDPEIKLVTCKAERFNKKGRVDIFTPAGGKINNFLFANAALGSSMFKRKDWEDCGGYEEILPILGLEDWEFYIRVLKTGGYAYVLPEVLFHYQLREGSTTMRIRSVKHEKFRQIILKHHELYKQNFEGLVDALFLRIKNEEKQKVKILNGKDYTTGAVLLGPIRFMRKFYKNIT